MGGRDASNEVIQDPIGDRLGKGADVAKRVQIQLERFAFNALFLGYVANGDRSEVGLPGYGT